MYKRLLAQEPFLRLLAQSSHKRRAQLLEVATKEELTTLFEICLNIIKGNITLNSNNLKKLKRHKGLIRTLSDRKVSLTHKKKLVHQKGRGIGAIIGTIASLVLPLLSKLIK